jgi:hypothetical protein
MRELLEGETKMYSRWDDSEETKFRTKAKICVCQEEEGDDDDDDDPQE